LGLAIGIACFIVTSLWVKDELSYDAHFRNHDRIYRIENTLVTKGEPKPMATADPRIAEKIREQYPEIENVTRIYQESSLLINNDKKFFEEKTFYADSTFFDIFSYEFIAGDPHTALVNKGSVVITEHVGKKLFGDENPLGKTIHANNTKAKDGNIPLIITGVIKNHTAPGHFHPNVIISKFRYMSTFEHTYVLLREGYLPERFINHVWKGLYKSFFAADYQKDQQDLLLHRLQPLSSIHLGGSLWGDLEPNGDLNIVYIMSIVGLFILLIAIINYINLATAKSYDRLREAGVRKVLGADRKQIIIQFLTESVAISLLALILALALVEISLPAFNQLVDKPLVLDITNPIANLAFVLLAIVIGLASGIYPALIVSSFQPIKALKGTLHTPGKKLTLTKSLVIAQFSISIIMLIATLVVSKQLNYLRKQDLGFNKEQVLVVPLKDPVMMVNTERLKTELLKNPNIAKVSASFNIPGEELNHTHLVFETQIGMEPKLMNSMFVDYDFIDVLGLKLIEGQNFDKSMMSQLDTTVFAVVNESAARMLGWSSGAGKKMESGHTYGQRKGHCIGVVKDFNVSSLHEEIPPMVFALGTLGRAGKIMRYLMIRLNTTSRTPGYECNTDYSIAKNMNETISYVEKTYKSFSQGYPFEYSFLDENFNQQYRKEEHQNILFNWFAGLCIFISCLGLMGLASFSTKQRTKEISIRRISGASVTNIVVLLAKDFIKLVMASFVIAMPIANYTMNKWLQNFAYRTDKGWIVFALSGAIAICIALITISVQTIRAANKDPATVLKHE
jgi:putative ABC transport system permease protein